MSSPYAFRYEMTAEGLKKKAATKNIPKAQRRQLSAWLTEVQYDLMRSAAMMQKSGQGKKSSSMSRNIGFEVKGSPDNYYGIVGTGVNKKQSIKYAMIQDKGGTIRAKGKYLTIPAPGVKGSIRDYPGGFFMKTARGNLVYAMATGMKRYTKITYLFLLKKQVTLPATGWFSRVIVDRYQDLQDMMAPAAVLSEAEKMGGA